jgi:hypothetical protein
MYTLRKSNEVDNPHHVCAPLKIKLSVLIWRCIYYEHDEGFGTFTSVNGNANSEKYLEILENNLIPLYSDIFHIEVNISFKMTLSPSLDDNYSVQTWKKMM